MSDSSKIERIIKEYTTIFNKASIGVIQIKNNKIVEINSYALTLLECDKAYLEDNFITNLFAASDEYKTILNIVRQKDHYEGTHLLQKKDGQLIWSNIYIDLIDDTKDEKFTRLLFLFTDETQRKKYENNLVHNITSKSQELENSNNKLNKIEKDYHNLYNNIDVGLFRYDIKENKLIDCNPYFLKLFKYESLYDAIENYSLSSIHKELVDYSYLIDSMQESTFIEYDALLIKNSGATFWGKNKFLINCEQNLLEGFILDITERKLSRMLLEINEAKYKAVFHNCFVSIFILDINTLSVLDFNNNCSKLFKYSDNEFKSKKIHELNPDKRLLDLLNISDDYTNLDITFDNIIFKDSEGNDIYVELHINNIFYAKKNALCFNLRDITELKKMEEQIKSYEEQLSFDIKQQINNISLKLNEVNLQTTKNIQENNLLLKKFINNDALNREIQYGRY